MKLLGRHLGFYHIYVTFIIVGLVLRFTNLSQELWLDEAGQFWISQGQNHYQENLTRDSISQVWINNKDFNLDPPLFGTILYFWTTFNSSIVWLRLLPSLFGLVSIYFAVKTMSIFNDNKVLLAGFLSFMMTNYTLIYYSKELRSFSLSQALLMATTYYFVRYVRVQNNTNLARLMCASVISLFCLYSLWLFQVPLYILLVAKFPKKKLQFAISSIPISVFVFIIYWLQMRHQSVGFSLEYVKHFKLSSYPFLESLGKFLELHKQHWRYLFYYTPMFSQLNRHIATATRIVFDVLTVLGTLLAVAAYIQRKKMQQKEVFILYAMLIAFISMLSFWGKFPIGPNRWNLFYAPLEILLFGVVCSTVWSRFRILVNTIMIVLVMINIAQISFFPRVGPFLGQILEMTDLKNDNYYAYSWDVVPTLKYILLSKGGSVSQYYYRHNFDDILNHRQQNFTEFMNNNRDRIIDSKHSQHFIFSNINAEVYSNAVSLLENVFADACQMSLMSVTPYQMLTLKCNEHK